MRVLISHRYFWPDKAPDAAILRGVARHLVVNGCSVDVISSQPSYHGSSYLDRRPSKEIVDGFQVTRLLLPSESGGMIWRLWNAFYLGFFTILRVVCGSYDVIIVSTVPPVLGAFCSAISARITKSKLIYYCMDLHPEVGRVSGDFRNPFLYQMLELIDDWSCRQATVVLVHSDDMLNTLRSRRRGREYKIGILNSFTPPTDESVDIPSAFQIESGGNCLNLIYAGNVGRFQGLETLIEAMGMLGQHKDIELVVIGEGVIKKKLVQKAKVLRANVRFFDHQPASSVKRLIQQADFGIVILAPDVYKYAYPSKTMTYLEQGTPIIALVESESELAKMVLTDGCGFTIPNSSATNLAILLQRLVGDCSWKDSMKAAALSTFQNRFSTKVILDKWLNIVKQGRL